MNVTGSITRARARGLQNLTSRVLMDSMEDDEVRLVSHYTLHGSLDGNQSFNLRSISASGEGGRFLEEPLKGPASA